MALTAQPQAIGRNTVMALQAGAVFGWRGLIGELIARVRDELADLEGVAPAQIRTVMTGGLSASAWAQTIEVDIVDQHLALKGLAQFYREITGGPLEASQ